MALSSLMNASSTTDISQESPVSSSPEARPEVSVVLISFNTCALLRESLESVRSECAGMLHEIFVVDNVSTDGSIEMVEQEFPEVVLIRSDRNLGFGVANNLALSQARGRYFVLLNSDAFFTPGSLRIALDHMDRTPRCGLGGALLTGRGGSWQPSAKSFHSILGDLFVYTGLADRFPRSTIFGRASRTFADERKAAPVDWVPGAFAIIRPSALDQVGLFDPRFFLYYEEVDLCLRIKQAGMQVWYWPDIEITHVGGESSKTLTHLEFSSRAKQVVLWRMRSTLLYYRKHHGFQAWLAREMEKLLYRITIFRNRRSDDPVRQARAASAREMIHLMDRAWTETDGGRISPPVPW